MVEYTKQFEEYYMKIGIVGLGLIGGTIAKALNKNHIISAYDISKKTLDYALKNNIIHHGYDNIRSFLNENEVIYVCLYPKEVVEFISNYKDAFTSKNIIIEVSGVKQFIVSEIEKLDTTHLNIVYTHPIAGSEKIGVYHSNEIIFKNANYVVTPLENNKKEHIELAISLAREMGFLNISLLSPKEHDDIIAHTSQLTHVLSLSLVNSISTTLDTKKYIGDSYRDLTRISKINENLWPDLFLTNKQALLEKIEAVEEELIKFKQAIKINNKDILRELMIKSTSIRSKMDRGEDDES